MGVTGLWRLVEPTGKPVPVETLENKVLAVDISIWLHQTVKGYQDAKGAPVANAHLMGLFQRLCKLLYFRIKPVFVFDGGFPDLKRETIEKRQHNKLKYNSESERIKRELAILLSKKSAIGNLLGKEISPKKGPITTTDADDDLFKLPALPENKEESESESEDESSSNSSIIDLHSVDIESNSFKTLPVKEKYDLLIELKETRKMNSWGKIHELPKKSDNFSDFQMQRLLKRRKVQECLEETEKEMGDGGMSLNELESLLNEEGIDTKIDALPTRRIVSNVNTRFLLINNVKQALLDAKNREESIKNPGPSSIKEETIVKEEKPPVKDELEEDLERAIKMSLECADEHDTSNCTSNIDKHNTSNNTSKTDDSWTSVLSDTDYSHTNSEEEDGMEQPDMSSAKAYIIQYTDFTNKAIDEIITTKKSAKKSKAPIVDKILEEINNEKSIIVDKIDVSSDEDVSNQQNFINDNVAKTEEISDEEQEEREIDVDLTQASVLLVENPVRDIITLDTSTENDMEGDENETISNAPSTTIQEDNSLCKKTVKIESDSSNSEFEEVPDIESKSIQEDNSFCKKTVKIESDSSDSEFEEVPDIESKSTKPVIQLTLNMEPTREDDDIFADVFTKKEETSFIDTCVQNDSPLDKKDTQKIKNDEIVDNKTIVNLTQTYKEITQASVSQNTISSSINQKAEKHNNPSNKNEKSSSYSASQKENNQSVLDAVTEEIEKASPSDTQEKDFSSNKDDQSTAKNQVSVKETLSKEKLNEMAEKITNEQQQLEQEKGRLDRIGRNITDQMTKEAQELLQIFGIPYIVAPMEAEAQCAFLEGIKLTDGTITDDSDIWLFGGKTVYKNFFNQKKLVLQFLSERIEKSYNLTREQLILLALLVGSDYTTGVDGVGPVTALEILASFPFNKKQFLNETSNQGKYQQVLTGLQEFKKWVRAGKRTDNTTLKKKLRNVTLSDDFPSVRVVQAYFEPNVENSKDTFTWGDLDITVLRDYTKAKFGWSQNKLDEILKPVIKRQMERKTQKTVHDYFKRKVEFQSLEHQMSKRVKAAVQKMGPEIPIDDQLLDEIEKEQPAASSKPPRKRKYNAKKGNTVSTEPGLKRTKNTAECNDVNVKTVAHVDDSTPGINIIIPKTDKYQEIIPQREKDKQCLLQNRMKAIEIFRKTKIDRKKKVSKKKVILPKDKADLSESSDGD